MCNSVGDQKLSASVKIKEGVHLVEQLTLLVPNDPALTASSDLGLSNNVPTFHCREIADREALAHRNPVGSVSFHDDAVAAIELEEIFLEVDVQRDFGAIVSRHHEVLAVEFIPNNLRTKEFEVLFQNLLLLLVLVLVKLLVDEGRRKQEANLL